MFFSVGGCLHCNERWLKVIIYRLFIYLRAAVTCLGILATRLQGSCLHWLRRLQPAAGLWKQLSASHLCRLPPPLPGTGAGIYVQGLLWECVDGCGEGSRGNPNESSPHFFSCFFWCWCVSLTGIPSGLGSRRSSAAPRPLGRKPPPHRWWSLRIISPWNTDKSCELHTLASLWCLAVRCLRSVCFHVEFWA